MTIKLTKLIVTSTIEIDEEGIKSMSQELIRILSENPAVLGQLSKLSTRNLSETKRNQR